MRSVGDKLKILFLCTGNSCRSQMAEGWARHLDGDTIEAYSAGIETHGLNPDAVRVMAEAGVDIAGHRSKHVDELKGIRFDYVVTVCGHAHESCPRFPGRTRVVHVGFDDPPRLAASARTDAERLGHYRRVRDEIRALVAVLPEALPGRPGGMSERRFDFSGARCVALMGGAYGNLPALQACVEDARAAGADVLAFLGDALGACGHSDETLAFLREHFQAILAGNHEREAAAGSSGCGCGLASPEDERISCQGQRHALESLSASWKPWLDALPSVAELDTAAGRLLLSHGSPARINEFLYETRFEEVRWLAWLRARDAVGLGCTHTGLPWIRRLPGGRLAANCGAAGKPDNDGDPAVHYALLTGRGGSFEAEIRRVVYDHRAWAERLAREGVESVFTETLRTGWWQSGTKSLPESERRTAPCCGGC